MKIGIIGTGLVDGVVDFIRFQIAAMGRGPLTTISLDGLSEVAP